MNHVVTGVFRRGGRAVRSLGPSTVAVTLALIIGAAGFADAATGGNFLLGKSNTESSTAVMTDTTGIPLSPNAPSGKSPLSVNSSTQVNRLNAQYVGGDSASQVQATGGEGLTAGGVDIPLTDSYTPIVSTGRLQAGTYYVSATALFDSGGSAAAYCAIIAPNVVDYGGGGNADQYSQAAETVVATVPAGTVLSEECYGAGGGQSVYNAGITAIRISSNSVGTVPTEVRSIPVLPYGRKGGAGGPVIGPLNGRTAH
jgi:hypothetical protein